MEAMLTKEIEENAAADELAQLLEEVALQDTDVDMLSILNETGVEIFFTYMNEIRLLVCG